MIYDTMVSLIQSNYRGMGSGCTPDGLGFALQDRGELFNLAEGQYNSYAPHKRPFHTIIPAFVTHKGKPFINFGVMGGATQPQVQAQILVNMVDFDHHHLALSASADPAMTLPVTGSFRGFTSSRMQAQVKMEWM